LTWTGVFTEGRCAVAAEYSRRPASDWSGYRPGARKVAHRRSSRPVTVDTDDLQVPGRPALRTAERTAVHGCDSCGHRAVANVLFIEASLLIEPARRSPSRQLASHEIRADRCPSCAAHADWSCHGELKTGRAHHVPAGVPKTGRVPHQMTTRWASLLSGRRCADVAMTGEVTDRAVLRSVVKQKLLAAHRAGITPC